MKFVLTLVVSILALAAPNAIAQRVDAGFKGGVSLATVAGIEDALGGVVEIETTARTGIIVGGFVSWRLNDVLSLGPEVLFVQKGIDVAGRTGTLPLTFEADVDYIEVPVLATWEPRPHARIRGYLFGGPAVAFRVDAAISRQIGATRVDLDPDEGLESTDVGVAVGGGIAAGRVLFEVRLTEGFTNIAKPAAGLDDSVRNRVWGFLLGVAF
jgi:hypothetical protein